MKSKLRKFIIMFIILFLSIGSFLYFTHDTEAKDKKGERKILYYRNPMNPAITSDVPMKDSMGMDYIPVYEETEETPSVSKEEQSGIVKLSQRDIFLAGVKSEPVTFRHLFKEIRTVGRIAYDPELYKAEEEFIQAIKAQEDLETSDIPQIKKRGDALIEASRLKLRLQGLSDEQIDELSTQTEPDRSLIISDKKSPYVWVYADVYEYELSWVKVNQPVKVTSISFPGKEFSGKITAIDPTLNPMTRSVRLRAKIDNSQLKLKPQMYVDVIIESYIVDENNQHAPVLAIPKSAILDTGVRKVVYLDLGSGSYLGREVQIGPEAIAYVDSQKQRFYPVENGLKEKDLVVTKANFFIDSQSQLSGTAASAYGGALGQEETEPAAHQH